MHPCSFLEFTLLVEFMERWCFDIKSIQIQLFMPGGLNISFLGKWKSHLYFVFVSAFLLPFSSHVWFPLSGVVPLCPRNQGHTVRVQIIDPRSSFADIFISTC